MRMSLVRTRHEQLFPVLTAAQIDVARRFASSAPKSFAPNDVLYAVGERQAPVFIVTSGDVLIRRRHATGKEELVAMLPVGGITGEINQLAGRSTLAEARGGVNGCEVLPFDGAHLRALITGSAELGEIVMRAFILRRTALISEGAGSILAGRPGDPALARLEEFLSRNGYPYSVLDVAGDGEGHALVERFGLRDDDLPIVLCPNGALLRRPSDIEVAACVGITPELDPQRVFDVAVVGAGPAGRPAPRRESRTIWDFPPAFPAMRWPPAPSSRRRNSVRRSPSRSACRHWNAAVTSASPACRSRCVWRTARACRHAASWWPRVRVIAGSISRTSPCSRAPACPTGPRRWRRNSAKARRSPWSA